LEVAKPRASFATDPFPYIDEIIEMWGKDAKYTQARVSIISNDAMIHSNAFQLHKRFISS